MKSHTLVYRTLVFSLYPEKLADSSFQRLPDNTLVVKTGVLAKRFRISVERMKDQLRLLEEEGFISNLVLTRYYATYKVLSPQEAALGKNS